jgi:hypothetical protein
MESIEESPSSSFGYDFEDSQTRAQLELIDDLQKLGVSKYVDLPQVRLQLFYDFGGLQTFS